MSKIVPSDSYLNPQRLPEGRTPKRAESWRCLAVLVALLIHIASVSSPGQGGGHFLFGDVKVDDSNSGGASSPITFFVILYSQGGSMLDRQVVPRDGRYRFNNVRNGEYEISVEYENKEVARIKIQVHSVLKTDYRNDFALEMKTGVAARAKPSVIAADETYERGEATEGLYSKADRAIEARKYGEALGLLKQVVALDSKDFQAWAQIGMVCIALGRLDESDQAYSKALEAKPSFFLALLSLGKLRLMTKRFDGAVEVLANAVERRKDSAEANFYLGEAFLQTKRGSLGAKYLKDALRLDPLGHAAAHLRLADLYDAAGYRKLAAREYAEFLKKQPDYPKRRALEDYIAVNGRP